MNLELRGYVFFICGELELSCAQDMKKLVLNMIYKILGFNFLFLRENVLHILSPKRLHNQKM